MLPAQTLLPAAVLVLLQCTACERGEPPGADRRPANPVVVGTPPTAAPSPASMLVPAEAARIGTVEDNLPFVPDGTRIASTAWRTWVYTDTGPKRTRYGYLRVGSILDARGPEIRNEGCAGGWYRINPRGFVCIGMGATLDTRHPSVVASAVRPLRKQSLPYLYALTGAVPPLLYFRLASRQEMETSEGTDLFGRVATFRERLRLGPLKDLLETVGPPPDFLSQTRKLEKPYGTKQGLHFSAHAGRAAPETGFSIARVFDWEGRLFGMTTELELIGLERTKLVVPSEFRGVELGEERTLPVAFVEARYAQKYVANERGELVASGAFQHREALVLTGATRPGGMLEARGGVWAPRSILRLVPARTNFPSMATGDRKWIDVSINDQTLVAYSGRRPVYATLVSTGRGGLGDPETEQATVRGTFMIHQKEVSSTMDGEEDSAADSYALRDVPFVQYFHKGFALHGTYWHDEFGRIRSHGCVNLSPIDAAWLFEWTDPVVPSDWHGVLNKDRGTVVYVRP
ncbi:MAG TPA: L,D-transpeptidase [Polyangiaceae bacterium]